VAVENSVVPDAWLPAMLIALTICPGSMPSIFAAMADEPNTLRMQVS
jgi:hypothetical protein